MTKMISITPLRLIICVQSLYYIGCHATWQTIWYDDMSRNNGWSTRGDVEFGYDSAGITTHCVKLTHAGDTNAWMYRDADISLYSTVIFTYDIWTRAHEPGDACNVYYSSYHNGTTTMTERQSYDPGEQDKKGYIDQSSGSLDVSNTDTVSITFSAESANTGTDHCYVDNVSLRGTLIAKQPTKKPTAALTNKPTPQPTTKPTPKQTKSPTKTPTNVPNNLPIPSPTQTPSTNENNKPSYAADDHATTYHPSSSLTMFTTPNNYIDATLTSPSAKKQQNIGNFIDDHKYIIVIVLLVICILVLCLCIILWLLRSRRKQNENEGTDGVAMTNHMSKKPLHIQRVLGDSDQDSDGNDNVTTAKRVQRTNDKKQNVFGYVSDNIEDHLTPQGEGGTILKKDECSDCSEFKEGKIYATDGKFYCDQCWNKYDMDEIELY
eukprot:934656_1